METMDAGNAYDPIDCNIRQMQSLIKYEHPFWVIPGPKHLFFYGNSGQVNNAMYHGNNQGPLPICPLSQQDVGGQQYDQHMKVKMD